VNAGYEIQRRVKAVAGTLRFAPFDVSTEAGRTKERHRRAALGAAAGGLARGVTLLTGLVTVPLTLHYLGAERYGLWLAISSTVMLLGLSDFGLSSSLVTSLAKAYGRDDRLAAKRDVSSAFFMLGGVSSLLAVAVLVLYPHVPWAKIFNLRTPLAIAEAGPALLVFTLCFLANIPLTMAQKIHIGFQEIFASNLWQASAQLAGLVGTLLAIAMHASLPMLVLAMAGTPMIVSAANSFYVYAVQRPWLRPRFANASSHTAAQLAKTGGLFLVLQGVGAVAYQADTLIVAHFLGAARVAEYALSMKLFMTVSALLGFFLAPLWPAYGEAVARKDISWVRITFRRSLILSMMMTTPIAVLLALVGGELVRLWVGPSVPVPFLLLAACGVWIVVYNVTIAIAMLLNGVGAMTYQVACAILMALANVGLSVSLVGRLGTAGPVLGSIISVAIFILIPGFVYIPRLLKSLSQDDAANRATNSLGRITSTPSGLSSDY
jgi:O-antigen/teichoic acid export membrane protein